VVLTSLDFVQMDHNANSHSKFCTIYPASLICFSPSPNLPAPESYINPIPPDPSKAGPPPQLPAGYGRWREYRYDPNAVIHPAPAWLEGGSLSGWRAGGFLSGNARRADGTEEPGRGGAGGPGGPGGGGGGQGGERKPGGGWVKDLSTVLCFVSPTTGRPVPANETVIRDVISMDILPIRVRTVLYLAIEVD
jgi:hypothetical protein